MEFKYVSGLVVSLARAAAFYALGLCKAKKRPVCVITTSGTAAAELIPAAMEGYYTGAPLLFVTADRPRRFRGTGAPQSCEQVHLMGMYTPHFEDLAEDEPVELSRWKQNFPAHLNVCFEEKYRHDFSSFPDINFPIVKRCRDNTLPNPSYK